MVESIAKVKYLSVNEVIQRAADMTDEAWILMQEREGMLVKMPTIAEMQTTIEDRSKEKETALAL